MKSQILATKSALKKCVLKQAYAVALSSDAPKKIGAVLLKRNRIISSAVNSYETTHPVQSWAAQNAARMFNEPHLSKKTFLHSEIRVLIKARDDADTIVVCRVGGHGGQEIRLSRPCRICESYIRSCSNIVHVHYSTPQGFLYEYWGD